jgi:ADP-ribosyl-[dinitrogen reductase] hydrolase
LLGGAAGDGIGSALEGRPADASRRLPGPPWRLSDDTQLTFATCRAIVKARGVDPETIAAFFVDAFRTGVSGVGSSTLKALRDLAAGQHWALAGARGEFAAGNGAAMRIAPLAFFVEAPDSRVIRDVARITHCNDEAIAAATAVVRAMQLASAQSSRGFVLETLIDELPDTMLTDSLAMLASLPHDASVFDAANAVGTSGRAASSVALAIFVASSTSSMSDAVLASIRCGGDTDTIASMAAQLRAASGDEVNPDWLPHLPTLEVQSLAANLFPR